jgi:APA family basic amino acid/polyamine antiporter
MLAKRMETSQPNMLKKELSMHQIIAMAAGGMIAAWMVEIKYWFELSGPGSFWALAICALFVLPLCLVYSEMTSMLPFAGGENVWISNAFNWDIGFFAGWALVLLYVMAMPTVSYGIATMSGYIYPLEFSQVKVIAAVILVLWYILTNFEIKWLARIQSLMFWSTMVVSIFASITFISNNNWSYETLSSSPSWFPNGLPGFSAAVGLIIMKFVGFDLIPQLAEEANFPVKKLWKANLAVGVLSIYFTVFAPETWINYIYSIYGVTAGLIYFLVAVSFLILRNKQ